MVEAQICMQEGGGGWGFSAAEEHLSYGQKGVNSKRDELMQHREQPVQVLAKRKKNDCRVIKHANRA